MRRPTRPLSRLAVPSLLLTAVLATVLATAGVASSAVTAYPGQGSSWDANEPSRRVAVFGDSLVQQTKPQLLALAGTRDTALDVWDAPGAAPCDLLPQFDQRVRASGAERVELAFVGNATSACMTSRTGGRPPARLSPAQRLRIAALYEADLRLMIARNAGNGVLTYLVVPPTMAGGTWHGQLTAALTATYTRLAATSNGWVRLNAASREALTPVGYRSAVTLNGTSVRLRHRDGTHLFAPVGTTLNAQALLWPLLLEQ